MAEQIAARISSAPAGKRILIATAAAGTLDIAAAALLTLWAGRPADGMLRFVASGPFPDAPGWGAPGAALGLAVHYAIMAVMAAVFVTAADRLFALKRHAVIAGIGYGLVTWAVMNLAVMPLRWPALFPSFSAFGTGTQLFCHIVLVGIPIALAARR